MESISKSKNKVKSVSEKSNKKVQIVESKKVSTKIY